MRDEPLPPRHRGRRRSQPHRGQRQPDHQPRRDLRSGPDQSPFGKKSSVTYITEAGETKRETQTIIRDDFWAATSNKQLNFVQHVFNMLRIDGSAAIVVSDNVLSFDRKPGRDKVSFDIFWLRDGSLEDTANLPTSQSQNKKPAGQPPNGPIYYLPLCLLRETL